MIQLIEFALLEIPFNIMRCNYSIFRLIWSIPAQFEIMHYYYYYYYQHETYLYVYGWCMKIAFGIAMQNIYDKYCPFLFLRSRHLPFFFPLHFSSLP